MKETQIKQFFQMIKAGFESIAKNIGLIKVEIPETKIDMTGVVDAIGETNGLLKKIAEKEEEDYEITLKIE